MFERFNEDARRALFFAHYEARQLGSISVETEHLLLRLILAPTGVMSAVFTRMRLPLELLRRDVKNWAKPGQQVALNVELPFSAQAKRVMHQHAVTEADRLGHNNIGVEHLLLGILNEEGCVAASVLTAHGTRLDTCREEIVQARK
jgi:ATP-dependent Clp protease ATP-binding subunit ClpC